MATSASFTLGFLGDHIRIQHSDDYEITPEKPASAMGRVRRSVQ